MPALRKLHRIAFLTPSLVIDGPDAPYTREAGLLVWTACIETCQRHPGLAVYDPESTPLFPQDGHFAPQHARLGAAPTDAFWAQARRDELVWLELALPRAPVIRLHALARDGKRDAFEASGRNPGEQIHQALGAWLAARGLGALPRRFEAFTADELLATVRAIGPLLVEQAGKWTAHVPPPAPFPEDGGADDADAGDAGAAPTGAPPEGAPAPRPRAALGRALAHRLPAPLRVAALRAFELALREELGDLILAADADHPRALFAQHLARPGQAPDDALLRRVIAEAPGWARPYGELVRDGGPGAATVLEAVAGAGIAAMCRPGHLDVIATAAERLRADGRADEALRLMARAVRLHDGDPRAHAALLRCHRSTGRLGGWLAQAHRSGRAHGCPADPFLPWYPDQVQIDLHVADALLAAGRLDEAIALRASRLEGREAAWPRHARILARWREEPALVARSYAREGALRGDPARVLEGFAHAAPEDDVELAMFLDALVALGREGEAPLAWAEHGLGLGRAGPSSRLAAARGLLAAGEWRRGLEALWRAELAEPGRDEQVEIARLGLLASSMPLEVAETALAERLAIGAVTLARRMARDVADFVPHAARSSIVLRALGHGARGAPIDFDPAWIAPLQVEPRARRAADALFAEADAAGDPVARADRLVDRWLEAVYAHASPDEPAAVAQAAAYVAAQALARYFAGTTAPPSPLTGGLRLVAAEALALVRRHAGALADREARALVAAVEPLLRRVDRWLGSAWLATIERACGIDERAGGDVAGFVREAATVAARILGPEEVAVLSASVARLHRERPEGWESATGAQAGRLALHTGFAGVEEWADATVAQLAARAQDTDDAIDALLTACYLAEGRSAVPCVHAARVLFDAGRGPAALSVLAAGLPAASRELRERQLSGLAGAWRRASPGVPLAFDQAAADAAQALAKGDPARAEKLGRWAVALDPSSAEAHRDLGLALARQGKGIDALHHLTRGASAPAAAAVAAALAEAGRPDEAAAVHAYASRAYAGAAPLAPAEAPAEAAPGDPAWRARRAQLIAARFRTPAENDQDVTPRARAAAIAVLADTSGAGRPAAPGAAADRDALLCRMLALEIRAQAHFPHDPAPRLGERLTRDAFHRAYRARGGALLGEPAPAPPPFADRAVVPGGKVARASDYVALLRDLAALTPREALAQFDLDEAGYLEVAKAWSAAIEADPDVAALISAGLAKR